MSKYKDIEKAFLDWKKGHVPVDRIPDGWVTVRGFAKKNKTSIRTTSEFFKQMREEGKVEMKKFVIDVGTKHYSVLHYKLK